MSKWLGLNQYIKKELHETMAQLVQWRQMLEHKLSHQLQQTEDLFNNARSSSIHELENLIEREEITQFRGEKSSFYQFLQEAYWNMNIRFACNMFCTSVTDFIRQRLPSVNTSNI